MLQSKLSKGEWMVLFQLYREEENREQLFDYILEIPKLKLWFCINPKQNDSIYDLDVQTYFGEGFIL